MARTETSERDVQMIKERYYGQKRCPNCNELGIFRIPNLVHGTRHQKTSGYHCPECGWDEINGA